MEKREVWSSRMVFILAAIGSAVGLGNAWRFPGLAAKYGGGAFLLVYIIAMFALGIPMLTMEIALGRKTKQGEPGAFRKLYEKAEYVGWAATTNAFVISVYYAVVFAWILVMIICSFKFAELVGNPGEAGELFGRVTRTSWAIEGGRIPPIMFIMLVIAWVLIYLSIRKGTVSVGKVVKYTGLTLPLIFLVIMAAKGISMKGGMDGLIKLFTPNFKEVIQQGLLSNLIIDAIGQVFYSLSIMMAIMIAYGSYVQDSANIAKDAVIIAFADLGISILSGIVMFTTIYGVGMTTADMSDSGIATAFLIFPQAIASITTVGWFNAAFGCVFYLCLASLAVDTAFSIVEGVSTAVADRFKLNGRHTTQALCLVAGMLSLIFITRSGVAWLDIVDNWTNKYNMIIIGVLECVVIGWISKPEKILEEANKNTKGYKMPKWWFVTSIKFITPLTLIVLCTWNLYSLFAGGGIYGGYPLWSNIVGGWLITGIVFGSGFIAKLIIKNQKEKLDSEDK